MGVLLAVALCVGLFLRIAAFLSLKNSVYFDFLLWDERIYHTWAEKIANGTYTSTLVYEFAPLPAYLLAFLYKIFSPDPTYFRIANLLLGMGTCYVVYLIGKTLANHRVGLIACFVACLYKPFILYSVVPMKTSLSVFLFAVIVYLFLEIFDREMRLKAFVLGVVVGLMVNVRPNGMVLIPFLPLPILWRFRQAKYVKKYIASGLLLYFLGVALALSPFVIRNYRVSGKASLMASQSGFNLYIANNLENPIPYYRPLHFATSSPFEQGVQFTIEASRRSGKRLSPEEASAFWTNEVFKIAWENPTGFAWKIIQKVLVLFNRFEAGDHYHIGFLSNFAPFFKTPLFSLWMLLPFGLAGMALESMTSKKALAVAVICFLYACTLVVFFSSARYRLPLMTVLIPFSVMGMGRAITRWRKKEMKPVLFFLGVTGLFFLMAFLPVYGTKNMAAYYNTHAIVLNSGGHEKEAMAYWEMSSRMNQPYSAFANMSLAATYKKKGDFEKAVSYLKKIPETSFAAAYKYAIAGDMAARQKKWKEAIAFYEESLRINSGQRTIRLKLARMLKDIDRKRGDEEYEKYRFIASFYKVF